MQSLNSRLLKYLENNTSLKNKALGSSEVYLKAEEYAEYLRSCVEMCAAEASLPIQINTFVGSTEVIDGHVEIEVNIDHESTKRESFSSKSGELVPMSILLNNGWSYTSNPPVGNWHGKRTVAWQQRTGARYVQSAAAAFKAGVPSGVTVEYDPIYDG